MKNVSNAFLADFAADISRRPAARALAMPSSTVLHSAFSPSAFSLLHS
jgi:hypothetical protein